MPFTPEEFRQNFEDLLRTFGLMGGADMEEEEAQDEHPVDESLEGIEPQLDDHRTYEERTERVRKQRDRAQSFLRQEDPTNPGCTFLETYLVKKQTYEQLKRKRAERVERERERFIEDENLPSLYEKELAYALWLSKNARHLGRDMQGAYMAWVVDGRKLDVEYRLTFIEGP